MARNFENTEFENEEFSVAEDFSTDAENGTSLVDYLMRLYREYEASQYRAKKLEQAKDGRKAYDGDRDTKTFPWDNCSNYSLMVPAIVVDNLEPRLVGAVAGKDRDIVEVIPNSTKGTQYVQLMEQFCEWALAHNVKWQQFIPQAVHDVLLDGTVYVFPHYEEEVLKRGERFVGNVPVDAISGERLDPETMQLYQQAGLPVQSQFVDEIQQKNKKVFRVVNEFALINEVYGPDLCPDWDETPTIRKQFFKYDDLVDKSRKENSPYINITEDLKNSAKSSRPDEDKPTGSDRDGAEPEKEREDIEVLTFYLKYDLDGSGKDWCIIMVAKDTNTIIRKQYVRDVFYGLVGKPVKRLIICPDSGRQFGTGIPHKIRHFASAINDCLNQMIDSGTVQINPWFFYGSDAGIQEELDISPGGANPVVGNAQSVVFPQLGVKAQVYIEFINLITAYLERLVALSSYQSGAEDQVMGQGAGTAAGMRMILQEAQVKHTYQAKPLKEQLGEVIKLDMMLYSWYMPTDIEIALPSGAILRQVPIDALQQDYDFSIRISDSAYNQMMERYEAQELMNIAGQLPFANQIENFKDMLNAYDKKNPEAYINPAFLFIVQAVAQNPEIPQVIQQYMQQKMQQQHQGELQQAAQDAVMVGQMKEKLMEPMMTQQLTKKVQQNLVKDDIKDRMQFEAALEHKDLVGPKDIEDAMASKRRNIAKDLVEGSFT